MLRPGLRRRTLLGGGDGRPGRHDDGGPLVPAAFAAAYPSWDVHFEVYPDGTAVDSLAWLQADAG